MQRYKVPVYNAKGEVVAMVSPGMTSIGAAKILGTRSAKYTYRFGRGGWEAA